MNGLIKTENALLENLAKIKAEIQAIQLWVDDASTNRIARIRYEKNKDKLKNLVGAHKSLFQKLKKLNLNKQIQKGGIR